MFEYRAGFVLFSISTQFVFLYVASLGFAMAGVAACAFEYAMNRRLRFAIGAGEGFIGGFCGLLIRMVAGPYLVARILREVAVADRQPLVLSVGGLLVVAWSLSLGVLIIVSLMT